MIYKKRKAKINQAVDAMDAPSTASSAYFSANNCSISKADKSLTLASTSSTTYYFGASMTVALSEGHVYYFRCSVYGAPADATSFQLAGAVSNNAGDASDGVKEGITTASTASGSAKVYFNIVRSDRASWGEGAKFEISDLIFVDLTDVYGAGNEPASVDGIDSYVLANTAYYPLGSWVEYKVYEKNEDGEWVIARDTYAKDEMRRVIAYKGDHGPVAVYKGGKRVLTYTEKSASGSSVSFASPYKPSFEIKGNSGQSSRSVRVLGVDGYALKANQIIENGDFADGTTGWTKQVCSTISVSDGVMTVTASSGAEDTTNQYSVGFGKYNADKVSMTNGHVYFVSFWIKSDIEAKFYFGAGLGPSSATVGTGWQRVSYTFTWTPITSSQNAYISVSNAKENNFVEGTKFYVRDVMLADLTEMFGAGSEPSTADAFLATKVGSLYARYVDCGKRIVGAGEYRANQIADYSALTVIPNTETNLSIDGSTITFSGSGTSSQGLYANGIAPILGHKYYLALDYRTSDKSVGLNYRFGGFSNAIYASEASKSHVFECTDASKVLYLWKYKSGSYACDFTIRNLILVDLTDAYGFGNEPTDASGVRPDLLVSTDYCALGTKKNGIVLSDGSVLPLDSPLYGVGTAVDTGRTSGTVIRRIGSRDYEDGDEDDSSVVTDGETTLYALDAQTLESHDPLEPASSATCVNEDATASTVTTPTPEFPEEVRSVSAVTVNGVGYLIDLRGIGGATDAVFSNDSEHKGKAVALIATKAVDLGTLDWGYAETSTGNYAFQAYLKDSVGGFGSEDLSCDRYAGATASDLNAGRSGDYSIAIEDTAPYPIIGVRDSRFADASSFASAVSGAMLYYQAKEPTEEDISSDALGKALLKPSYAEANEVSVDGGGSIGATWAEIDG